MKFLCDIMVQKLGRLLILSGFDTHIIKTPIQIDEICRIAQKEDRVILTRNTKIKSENISYLILIEQNPYQQFKKVIKHFNLKLDEKNFFQRCSYCNEELKIIEKDEKIDKIPPLTRQNVNIFYVCPMCKKIYWKASHLDLFKKNLLNKLR
ncbi:MAG: Mut7-C RNAse domain-containing protein [Elusimicrobiota bacterium]